VVALVVDDAPSPPSIDGSAGYGAAPCLLGIRQWCYIYIARRRTSEWWLSTLTPRCCSGPTSQRLSSLATRWLSYPVVWHCSTTIAQMRLAPFSSSSHSRRP
jgi:hypothetical protein